MTTYHRLIFGPQKFKSVNLKQKILIKVLMIVFRSFWPFCVPYLEIVNMFGFVMTSFNIDQVPSLKSAIP